jgi:uracil-DNA glycosylase family 4
MINKPAGCATCPLREKGKGFVPDEIVPNAEFVLYGEAPGKSEVASGKPFQGQAGFVLKEWLMRAVPQLQLAKEKKKVSYMNVLRCLPPEIQGRPYPKGQEKVDAEACCSQYRDNRMAPTIVLCGESPQRAFFGPELEAEDLIDRQLGREAKGVMGRVGRVYEKDGKRWVFAPHPAYILRQPALVAHGQEALRIAANTERVVEPDYVHWESAMGELA